MLFICSLIDHMWCQNMARTKKWHMRCSFACSSFQFSIFSKWSDRSKGVKKQGRLQHCLLLCYVLLTECVEQARCCWVCHWCSWHILTSPVIHNSTERWHHGIYLFYPMKKQKLLLLLRTLKMPLWWTLFKLFFLNIILTHVTM